MRIRVQPAYRLAITALTMTMWFTPRTATGASTTLLRAVAQRDGLRLELTIARRAYPRNALIQVRAVARNVSHHKVWLLGNGPQAPGAYVPQVEVLDAAGHSLPLSLTSYVPYPGPLPGPIPVAPGKTFGGLEQLVLRGSSVRMRVTILPGGNVPAKPGSVLHTRVLRVHLLPADPPTVQMSGDTAKPSATIVRPAGVVGRPQAVWYADCGGVNYDQSIYWVSVSTHLVPACSPLHAWHVLVGWQGHSVAAIEIPPTPPSDAP